MGSRLRLAFRNDWNRRVSSVTTSARSELPTQLRGVILNNVPIDSITTAQLARVDRWVRRGGTLFIGGQLNKRQRELYLRREQSDIWQALTPLSARLPIPQDRKRTAYVPCRPERQYCA